MALSPVTINGTSLATQPSILKDYKEYQQSEQIAVDGAMQRNRMTSALNPLGQKFVAELTWEDLPVASFTQLNALFTSGSGVVYSNPSSKYGSLTYSGLPFVEEGEYVPGESLLARFKVRIRQI